MPRVKASRKETLLPIHRGGIGNGRQIYFTLSLDIPQTNLYLSIFLHKSKTLEYEG